MLGFVVGIATGVGLGAWMRRRRWRHGHGHGHGGCRPGDGWRPGGGWRRGFGPLGWMLSRIDASPEQARVIRNEVESFYDKAKELKRELRLSRDDIARAVRNESFDAETMGESFGRQDDRLRELRQDLVGALARVHAVLDERQRRRLADLLEGAGHGGYGPYR
jgi:hypothetical protein